LPDSYITILSVVQPVHVSLQAIHTAQLFLVGYQVILLQVVLVQDADK